MAIDILGDGATVAGVALASAIIGSVLGPILFGQDTPQSEPAKVPVASIGGRPEYLVRQSWAGRLTEAEWAECARLCELGVLVERTTLRGSKYPWHHFEVYRGPNYHAA